ncbi:TPA: hypothetical protein ACH3X3_012178 [Trebouxia sp. C0006]
MFLLVCWCHRTSLHCRTSCGGACVTMLVTLGGKRRWLGCSCALDDKNPDRFNLRHVALAFQQYSKKKKLIAENDEERQRRLSVCTTIIGAVVGKMEPVPDDLSQWCQRAADSNPDGVLAFCSQWAQTFSHVTYKTASSCHLFE